jgi:uncharacterized protein (TIGR00106 family)
MDAGAPALRCQRLRSAGVHAGWSADFQVGRDRDDFTTPIRLTAWRKSMRALAEIQVIPLGVGVSVRKEVRQAHQILVDAGLKIELHAYGTNVEGELDDIFAAVKQIHETLHASGVARLSTAMKIGTRTDKEPHLADKKL